MLKPCAIRATIAPPPMAKRTISKPFSPPATPVSWPAASRSNYLPDFMFLNGHGMSIIGLPELPLFNIVLQNVGICGVPTGLWLRNALATLANVQISPDSGPPLVIQENAAVQEQ